VDRPVKKEDRENKIYLINCGGKNLTVCVVPGPTGITVVTIIGCWLVTSIKRDKHCDFEREAHFPLKVKILKKCFTLMRSKGA
jgi:hypothetical protein